MLQTASIILSIWSVINFFLAFIILTVIILFKRNAPILVMVYKESEITNLDDRVISAVNTLAILYNSCAAAISISTMYIIWTSLIKGQVWAFLVLLITIGFMQIFGFVAFALIGNQRWQVNIPQSALYLLGIGLSGYSLLIR